MDTLGPEEARRRLAALAGGTTPDAALALFDPLPPVAVEDLLGRWRGTGVPTGHPFDGLLEVLGWYGKRMVTPDVVHPLVFRGAGGRLVAITPTWLPLRAALRLAPVVPRALAGPVFALVRPLVTTSRPQARLREVTYRGVPSGAMVYDRLPVVDAFRRVDDETVLGVMDMRWQPQPYVFALRRERDASG
ncbi:DUF4334 domain-containing protein [Cellulomonas sp. JZ18]|uniref:DUF4334 domain-containing protein n=1 Tax=Cellulomonas sp. JZ18 TaxID=2654191 RepID=UPI0012D435D2|nr:DUF4334 domain-containing protein [Cellulomonas sp. JZ18]QGQ20198.1 DUF4334 domain-containing protein [Cellulomonas sp. JZ18]